MKVLTFLFDAILFDTMKQPRRGLPSDVDSITNVITNSMPDDPQWIYRFPLRLEFPDDHRKYTRMLLE